MILSYDKQFCFIHVGKTAGTNVARALEPYAHRPELTTPARWLDKLGIHANYLGPHRWRRFRIHATAATVRRHLPRDVWAGLYTFGFVRNPYAWLVSQHRHMLRQPSHHRHATVKQLGTFDAYVAWEAARRRRTQRAALCDRQGRVLVDFVGRFETLADDFAAVCERVGLDVPRLPGGNEGNADDYREAYGDPRTRSLAESLVAEDAKLFGYTIDGPTCATRELNRRVARG